MTAPRFAPTSAPPAPGFAPRPRPAPAPAPRRRLRTAPAPTPAAPPVLRLVDPAADRQRRRTRALTAALVVAICAGLFAIVALRVLLAQGQVDVDRLQTTVDSRQAAQERLHLSVAQLEAPTRIVAEARSRLGMVNPGSVITLAPPPPATAR
jgi:cell division protein FtsL